MGGPTRKSAAPKARASSPSPVKGSKKARPSAAQVLKAKESAPKTKRKTGTVKEAEEDRGDEEEAVRKKMKRGPPTGAGSKLKSAGQQSDAADAEDDEELVEEDEADEDDEGEVGGQVTQTPGCDVDLTKYIRKMDEVKRRAKQKTKTEHASMKKLLSIFEEAEGALDGEEEERDGARIRIEEVSAILEEQNRESVEYVEKLSSALRHKGRAWGPAEEAFKAFWQVEHKKLSEQLKNAVSNLEGWGDRASEANSQFHATQSLVLTSGTDKIQESLDSRALAHRARKFILA